MTNAIFFLPLIACLIFAGCVNTHGNRRESRPMVARVQELRSAAGKAVTLVGTARRGSADGCAIELLGGTVELPAYTWPEGYVGQRVTVSGTVIDSHDDGDGRRVYRLGEIQSSSRWSR